MQDPPVFDSSQDDDVSFVVVFLFCSPRARNCLTPPTAQVNAPAMKPPHALLPSCTLRFSGISQRSFFSSPPLSPDLRRDASAPCGASMTPARDIHFRWTCPLFSLRPFFPSLFSTGHVFSANSWGAPRPEPGLELSFTFSAVFPPSLLFFRAFSHWF